MNELLKLSDEDLLDKAQLSEAEFDRLENQLAIFAACSGWTGDPLRQPAETVARLARGIIAERST